MHPTLLLFPAIICLCCAVAFLAIQAVSGWLGTAPGWFGLVGEVLIGPSADAGPARSPGLLTKHYAPRTALECAATDTEREFLANLYETAGLNVARLAIHGEPAAAGARLYADLHAIDAREFDRVIVTLPPDADEWRAIRDRLARAATVE